ncbi:TolC family protein [Flavitalea sp.]|nr:TolC family protein [Flavitalea sp.]
MKKIFFACALLISIQAVSQSINDSIVNIRFTLEDTIANKLAELAVIKNPEARVYDHRANADLYEWRRSRLSILSAVSATFNLNEGNLKSSKDSAGPLLFYPRYNFSLSVPLGLFFTKPQENKRARSMYDASVATKDAEINNLKSQVKKTYQTYIANKYLLSLQETLLQDEVVLFSQVQDKFEKNQLSLELFTNASKRINAELVKKLNLVRDVGSARIDLELLIGMDLMDALALIAPRRS